MTADEIKAAIRKIAPSPKFFEMAESTAKMAVLHEYGYQTLEELHLLGLMVKYLCLRGKCVTVVSGDIATD
jgi:hypothetical protein